MFTLAMPAAALGVGIVVYLLQGEAPTRSLASIVGEEFESIYLLAWPIMTLLAVLHTAWLQALSASRRSPPMWIDVGAAVCVAGTAGLVLALLGRYSLWPSLALVAEYITLGAVYGVARRGVTRLFMRPDASAQPVQRPANPVS
jgi:hypothetical protein